MKVWQVSEFLVFLDTAIFERLVRFDVLGTKRSLFIDGLSGLVHGRRYNEIEFVAKSKIYEAYCIE